MKALELAKTLSNDAVATAIKLGESGCSIFRVKYGGKDAVLKCGTGERGLAKMRSNFEIFEKTRDLGVIPFVGPNMLDYGEKNGFLYQIMDYAGKDFREIATTENSLPITQKLMAALRSAYSISKSKDKKRATEWLNLVKEDLLYFCDNYIIPAGYLSEEEVNKLRNFDVEPIAPEYVTWATADLTPDNVIVSKDNKVTVIDPYIAGRGVPLIDLAMYAVLTEEVYALPNGRACAEEIRSFSSEVAQLLDTNLGDLLFKFGEVRQYILSSRFRIDKDTRAESFAKKAIAKLEEIINDVRYRRGEIK